MNAAQHGVLMNSSVQFRKNEDASSCVGARGPRTAPLSGAGGLDSHRQNGLFLVALGYLRFVGESRPIQPPVTRAVGWLVEEVVEKQD